MDISSIMNQLFHAGYLDSLSLNETKGKLRKCTSKLEEVLEYSTKLEVGLRVKPVMPELSNPQWQIVVDTISTQNGAIENDDVSKWRWEIILYGWFPQLQELTGLMEQLRVADKRITTENTSHNNSERAPLDVLSIRMICVVHCGLELITQWGIGTRLNSDTYGYLCRHSMKPLSKTVLKLFKMTSDGVNGSLGSTSKLFSPVYCEKGKSDKRNQSIEYTLETISLRQLRLCACSIVIEKCLNIPQIRSLLLPRYYPYLIVSFLGLANSSHAKWAQDSLVSAFNEAPICAELDGQDHRSEFITPAGFSIVVRSLRELSSIAKGKVGEVGAEIGGLLSAVVCMEGGLEAVLDSFVGPVNASQAAEDGSVEAVEALARHLASPPMLIDKRIISTPPEWDSATKYNHSICSQLGRLLRRSLFVYGLGNVQMDDGSQGFPRLPPSDALSGLMAHMVVRLIGRTAETVIGDPVKEDQFRKFILFPLLQPILLASLTDAMTSEHSPREYSAPHEIHSSLICLHSLSKLVSPTPALVKLVAPSPQNSMFLEGDATYKLFCEVGVLPCLINLLCFLSSEKRLVADLNDKRAENELVTVRRVRESIISLLSFLSPSQAAQNILVSLHNLTSTHKYHFVRLEGDAARKAEAEAISHGSVSDGIALSTAQKATSSSVRESLDSIHIIDEDIVSPTNMKEAELVGVAEMCYGLVLEVDSTSSRSKADEDFMMVALFELLLSRFLDHEVIEIRHREVEMVLFSAITSNSDPLQLLASTKAGLGVLRTVMKLVPSLTEAFTVDSDSPLISSRVVLVSLVLEMLTTLVVLGPPPDSDTNKDREGLLKSLVVPLGTLSIALTSEAHALSTVSGDAEDEEPQGHSMLELAEKCQELHLQLIRRWSSPVSVSPQRLEYDDWNEALTSVVEAASKDLMTSSPPLRARAVFDISNILKKLSQAAQSRQLHTHSFIEEVEDSAAIFICDKTLGYLLGVLLGMLADSESYVYLGAVHAIHCLTDIPPQATRSKHIKILVSFFAQAPLVITGDASICMSVRESMAPFIRFHLNQTSSIQENNQDLMSVLDILDGSQECNSNVVPLTYSQRLNLGEALVLTVRWCGTATPHHASMLFPALIRGASAPSSNQLKGLTLHHRRSLAAFRSSCFSAIAEIGGCLGWAIQRYATDLVDICCSCLRLERDASNDIFQFDPQSESEDHSHALAARRGAAFLGRRLIESCGFYMLQSGDSKSLHNLHQLFVDINEGPGVSRASVKLNTDKSTEWSFELDPIVRDHVACGIESMDSLLLQGTSGLATYVLPK